MNRHWPWRSLSARHRHEGPRETVALIRMLLGFEAVVYSVLTPLLPHYAHQFAASKPAIGVLAAAYPVGMIPGSLLGGWIATTAGVRRATMVGLLLFDASIIAFGFGSNLAMLDALRFVQGAACGSIWSGGLAWVIASTPRSRRGQVLGSVLATAIVGTLVGPVVGTLAVAAGTRIVFAAVGVVSIALTIWTRRQPEPPPARLGAGAPLRALAGSRRLVLGLWLILLEACIIGATNTLLPLRLSRLGASGVTIGVTFVLTALLSAILTPRIGRLFDRRGVALPLIVALGASSVLLALLPLPQAAFPLAVLTVLALGGPLMAATMAAMSLLTGAVERIGAALAFGSMLFNLAWALGETIGAPAAAIISRATSDTVPLVVLAGTTLLTLAAVLLAWPHAAAAPPAEAASAGGPSSAPARLSPTSAARPHTAEDALDRAPRHR